MKKLLLLLTILALTFNFASCSKTSQSAATTTTAAAQETTVATSDTNAADKVFTLEELSKYNGKDGMSAYVAYKGIVYDVTAVPEWKNGDHKNGIEAGIDATDLISQSPHGDKVFKKLPVVGTLK